MKFSLDWLREYLDTAAEPGRIAAALTSLGLEVEEVTAPPELDGFYVGEVVEVGRHPNADKLSLCEVRVKGKTLSVVCGAANVRRGLKSIFAGVGAKIPHGNIVIKKTVIRGIASEGMLCSAAELGLEGGDGIIELPPNTPPNARPHEALPVVFTVALTPNRSDCAGVLGIARELAAAGIGRLKKLPPTPPTAMAATPLTAVIKTDGCSSFALALIKGVTNLKSPEWLVARLATAGIGSVNAAVDVGNYFTIGRCRPLHVFDAAKVKSLSVEAALGGEKFLALDDKTYTLKKGMVAIKDVKNGGEVISLGGIIGGKASGVNQQTSKDILVECAAFDRFKIAMGGRTLRIESAARWRFERGVDDANALRDFNAALKVMVEVCGGTLHKPTIAGKSKYPLRRVKFDHKKVASLGGLRLTTTEINRGLGRLGFAVKGGEVTVPGWRGDIENTADLVEEVLRLNGYDCIASLPLPAHSPASLPKPMRNAAIVRRALAVRGMFEAVTWSFAERRLQEYYLEAKNAEPLRLANPINDNMQYLRASIIPNLLQCAAAAQARDETELALFELGPIWDRNRRQQAVAAGIRLGGDAFDTKLDVTHGFAALGLAELPLSQAKAVGYHPGICGEYQNRGRIVASFGVLHPSLVRAAGVKGSVAAFELFLEPLAACPHRDKEFSASRLQQTRRDFAFVVDADTPAAALTDAIYALGDLVSKAEVFDVYQGANIPLGKKSLAVAVTLIPKQKTLSGEEIEAFTAAAIKAVGRACRATLRQ